MPGKINNLKNIDLKSSLLEKIGKLLLLNNFVGTFVNAIKVTHTTPIIDRNNSL